MTNPVRVLAGVALAVSLVFAGTAIAQVNGPPAFFACHDAKGGELYNVHVAEPATIKLTCKKDDSQVEWNSVGPQGPAGVNGVAGYEVVRGSPVRVLVQPGLTHTATASCPTGKVALGGGGFNIGDISQLALSNSWPSSTDDEWNVMWLNVSAVPADLNAEAYAICATVSQ